MAYSNCEEVRLEFSALLDDELSAGERRAIEAHLADCPECLRRFHQFQQVDQMYQGLPQGEAPDELEPRIREALTAEREQVKPFPRPRHARQRVWPLLAAAAAFAILAGGVLMMATEDFGPESFQLARFDAPAEDEEAAPRAPAPEAGMDVMMGSAPDALDAEPMDSPADEAWDDAAQELMMNGIEHYGEDPGIDARGGLGGLGREAPEVFEQDSPAQRPRPRAEEPELMEPPPDADTAPKAEEETPEPEAEPAPPPPAPAEPAPEPMRRRLVESPDAETREAAGRRFAKDAEVWVEEGYEGEPVATLSPDAPPWEELLESEPELAELAEWEEPVVFNAEGQWRRLIPLTE